MLTAPYFDMCRTKREASLNSGRGTIVREHRDGVQSVCAESNGRRNRSGRGTVSAAVGGRSGRSRIAGRRVLHEIRSLFVATAIQPQLSPVLKHWLFVLGELKHCFTVSQSDQTHDSRFNQMLLTCIIADGCLENLGKAVRLRY